MHAKSLKLWAVAAVFLFVLSAVSPARADERDFRLHNNGTEEITGLWVSPHNVDSWGSDILSYYIDPGYYSDITFDGVSFSTCYYDLRILYADGAVRYASDWNLCTTYNVYATH